MSESLENIAAASRLCGDNAVVSQCGDLPSIEIIKEDKSRVKYDRIVPVRNFPFEYTDKYITILDNTSKEIGIIISLSDFPKEQAEILEKELNRRYYMPVVKSINKMKEKMGFSSWSVTTDYGDIDFSVRDTYKNVVRLPDGRYIISDVDGNRYEIKSIESLDKKSLKRIELII